MSSHNHTTFPSPAFFRTGSSHSLRSLLCALLRQSEAHPLTFQGFAHSLRVYPGCHQERFFHGRRPPAVNFRLVTPLDATLTAELRVLAEINRNCPPASLLDAILTETSSVTPLGATLTKTGGRVSC